MAVRCRPVCFSDIPIDIVIVHVNHSIDSLDLDFVDARLHLTTSFYSIEAACRPRPHIFPTTALHLSHSSDDVLHYPYAEALVFSHFFSKPIL